MEQKMVLKSHQGNPYILVAVFHKVSRYYSVLEDVDTSLFKENDGRGAR